MSYTTVELTAINNAIINLASGARRVRVQIGDKMIEYGKADLNELKILRGEIQSEISLTAGNKNYRTVMTSKGY